MPTSRPKKVLPKRSSQSPRKRSKGKGSRAQSNRRKMRTRSLNRRLSYKGAGEYRYRSRVPGNAPALESQSPIVSTRDEDPQRVKEVIGHVEQAAIMTDKGMSADQVIDAFKAGEKRKDNAEGGLNYLMGL